MIDRQALAGITNDADLHAAFDSISSDTDKAYIAYLRGRLAWKEGRRADAITFYTTATSLDSDSDAAIALSQAREIMAFYNKDLYNP